MLKQDIQNAIFAALKEKKGTDLKALRFILSQIKYAEIDKKRKLEDEEIISLLQKEIKKRKEAIKMFKEGQRDDLVKEEKHKISVIEKFLPEQLSEDELKKIIGEVIVSTEEKNIGKIIGLVMAKVKGRTDGAKVASFVKQKLTYYPK